MILFFGALFGILSIAAGAFAEHGLSGVITDEQVHAVMTAVRYNQFNAVVISAIGLTLLSNSRLAKVLLLKLSGLLFILGTVLFCFSIYLSVFLQMRNLVKLAPVGGMVMVSAWLFLLLTALFVRNKR